MKNVKLKPRMYICDDDDDDVDVDNFAKFHNILF